MAKKKKKKTRKSQSFKLELNASVPVDQYPGCWYGKQPKSYDVSAVSRPNTVELTLSPRVDKSLPSITLNLWMQDAKAIGEMLVGQADVASTLTHMFKGQA